MDSGESARLQDLYDYAILDTPPEPQFDRIARMTASIFDKAICNVTFVDRDRVWFKAHQGLDLCEIPRQPSFCDVTIRHDGVLVVPDARLDPRFAAAPFVTGANPLRFYAGAPLTTSRGTRIGSLCVIDSEPDHRFLDRQCAILADMAQTVMELVEARSRQFELARRTREIGHIARHDPLTGLGNRRQLSILMQDALISGHERDEVVMLYLDLDGFKAVNDSFGHAVGDHLLCQVADRLRTVVGEDGHITRMGGDEFAVVRFGPDSRRVGAALAARIVDMLARPFSANGQEIRIGTSVGMATAVGPAVTLDRLLSEADDALYRAKTEGRGRYRVFGSDAARWERMAPRRPVPMSRAS